MQNEWDNRVGDEDDETVQRIAKFHDCLHQLCGALGGLIVSLKRLETVSHPSVFGYYLRDEPSAAWFPQLEKVASVVRELAPGKWPYINLF